MKAKPFVRCMLLTAMVAGFSGCVGTSLPSRFYTLTPLSEKMDSGTEMAEGTLTVGIGPIRLADYLKQSHLVTRAGDNQLKEADFDRWAGTFEDNFAQVVAENMSTLLRTERIFVYPFQTVVPLDYRIVLNVVRFDGELGKSASLVARWRILRGADKTPLVIKRSSIEEPVGGSGYAALVAAQSLAVARLCREMVASLQSPQGRAGRPSLKSSPKRSGSGSGAGTVMPKDMDWLYGLRRGCPSFFHDLHETPVDRRSRCRQPIMEGSARCSIEPGRSISPDRSST